MKICSRGRLPRPLGVGAAASRSTLNDLSCRSGTKADLLSSFSPSLGSVDRGGDAFPFRRQAGEIVGHSGEIAVDRSGVTARRVSSRIFQGGGQFFLLSFQRRDFRLQFMHALFFFAPGFGNRITRVCFQTFLRLLFFRTGAGLLSYLRRGETVALWPIASRGQGGSRRRGF